MYKRKSQSERLEEIQALSKELERGVEDLFSSPEGEKYKAFLKRISHFHKYSIPNIILICLQMPQSTYVAGFNTWRRTFNRYVKKGEKGIKIFMPILRIDPRIDTTGLTKEEKEKLYEVKGYKIGYVYDISQTEGEVLFPEPEDETGYVGVDRELLLKATISSTKIAISYCPSLNGAFGAFFPDDRKIFLLEGRSTAEDLSTLFHELAHRELHTHTDKYKAIDYSKDLNSEEVFAESVRFVISSYFGAEQQSDKFFYIQSWSKNHDTEELLSIMKDIKKCSDILIGQIEKSYLALEKKGEAV